MIVNPVVKAIKASVAVIMNLIVVLYINSVDILVENTLNRDLCRETQVRVYIYGN